jgi:hypothetical protein
MHVSYPHPSLLLQRLPIRKKVFWDDLGVARKIYRNLALMPSTDEELGNDVIVEEEGLEEGEGAEHENKEADMHDFLGDNAV